MWLLGVPKDIKYSVFCIAFEQCIQTLTVLQIDGVVSIQGQQLSIISQ